MSLYWSLHLYYPLQPQQKPIHTGLEDTQGVMGLMFNLTIEPAQTLQGLIIIPQDTITILTQADTALKAPGKHG